MCRVCPMEKDVDCRRLGLCRPNRRVLNLRLRRRRDSKSNASRVREVVLGLQSSRKAFVFVGQEAFTSLAARGIYRARPFSVETLAIGRKDQLPSTYAEASDRLACKCSKCYPWNHNVLELTGLENRCK